MAFDTKNFPLHTGIPVTIALNHGPLALPVFLPDTTLGMVCAADARDLREAGVGAGHERVSSYSSSTVTTPGGLHRMAAWDGAVVTDSRGF
ncbi:MAG: hypothetical protein ACUVS4_03295 [Chloroflexaceae bacterium]